MKHLFLDIGTTIKVKLGSILEKLSQRHIQREHARFDMSKDDSDNETCASTQFLHIQKNQLIDLQEALERYCNVLPAFGFNSAKYDLKFIKSYLLPIPANERHIEPTVIKQANQFISFKFGDIQQLDILNFPGGATSLDSFLQAYETSRTKRFFRYEWFDHPDKLQIKELPRYDAFYTSLRSCNHLEAEYTDYVILSKNGLTTEQAVVKLKTIKTTRYWDWEISIHATDMEAGTKELFQRLFRWYNKKDVVPTLEAMQKKRLVFTTTKISICWSLVVHYQTWLTFAYTNIPMQNSVPSQREIKTYWKKIEKRSLVAHQSFLHAKQLSMKFLSESL